MAYEFSEEMQDVVQIKVIGVGGGGGNAVNRMVVVQVLILKLVREQLRRP